MFKKYLLFFFLLEREREKRKGEDGVGEGTEKVAERGRKRRLGSYCGAGAAPRGPVLLWERVPVRPGSASFTSFFHYSK